MSRLFRRARLGLGLVTVVSLGVAGNPHAAEASAFVWPHGGPQTDQTAMSTAPTALATSTPTCASSTYHTAVPLSGRGHQRWTKTVTTSWGITGCGGA